MSYSDCTTKTARIAYIRDAVSKSPKWALDGLMRIYANQTADERTVEETRHENGIGFTGADANILTSFAKQVERGRTMSPKQMALIHKKMPKYARQLEQMAEAKRVIEEDPGNRAEREMVEAEIRMTEMFAAAERESEARGAWSSMR